MEKLNTTELKQIGGGYDFWDYLKLAPGIPLYVASEVVSSYKNGWKAATE